MAMKMKAYKSVAEYIKSYPKDVAEKLKTLQSLVKKIAPKAEEGISYGMPAYKANGKPLVYFAAYEKHIGFYPTGAGIAPFKKDLTKYKTSKGAIQFPIDGKIPTALATRIIKYRLKQTVPKEK